MAYTVLVEKTIPVSRQRVYALLVDDFGGLKKVLPEDVDSCTVSGSGVGALRQVKLKGAEGILEERLDAAFDGRLMSYTLTVNPVLPLEKYHAVVELYDAPNGGCTVRWGSNWVAKGAPEAEVKPMIAGLYNKLIDTIAKVA